MDILVYNGLQLWSGHDPLPMFTDMLTGTTFMVEDHEEIWEALDRKRKQFDARPAIRPGQTRGE